jgi:hypothetical protein
MLSYLAEKSKIYLAGNLYFKPDYADGFLSLKPNILHSSLYKFVYNKYSYLLSNAFRAFYNIRSIFERCFDENIFKKLDAFFSEYETDVAYLFPWYPDFFPLKFHDFYRGKIVVEFWEDQIVLLYSALIESGIPRK